MDHHALVQEELCISDPLSVLKFSMDEVEFTSAILLQNRELRRYHFPTPDRRRRPVDDSA